MQTKTLSILTAAAITLGAAGFATSAGAAVPTTGLGASVTKEAKTNSNVQTVGYYYRYYRAHRRCYFVGYRRVWNAYYGYYVRKPIYRCWYPSYYHRPYYYYRPGVRIYLGY